MNLAQGFSAGLELELPVVSRLDGSSADGRASLQALLQFNHDAGVLADPVYCPEGGLIGVNGDWGLASFDNGFNNMEIAFAPVFDPGGETLNRLAQAVHQQLDLLNQALAQSGATLVSLAEHPDVQISPELYARMRVPKRIYTHWVNSRGWDHAVGIDAKAQNGPTTGVKVERAVEALNLSLLAAPALIALYANSPFESGKATGYKENRLQIWRRMFANARHPADRRLCELPARPFIDLGDYFAWMFGADTVMHPLIYHGGDYKSFDDMFEIEGEPSMLAFLAGGTRSGRCIRTGEVRRFVPSLAHFERMQFAHFLDARIRFGLTGDAPVGSLLAALGTSGGVESLFAELCSYVYIESRSAGTNLPEAQLLGDAGASVAASVVMGPSAIQKGLLSAAGAWQTLSAALPWKQLAGLRDAAIREGLQGRFAGIRVSDFCARVLALAADGLPASERWMLAHPSHVLETGQSGADRALHSVARSSGDMPTRLRELVAQRRFIPTPILPTTFHEASETPVLATTR